MKSKSGTPFLHWFALVLEAHETEMTLACWILITLWAIWL